MPGWPFCSLLLGIMMINVKKISVALMFAAGFASAGAFAQTTNYDNEPWYISPTLLGLHPDHRLGVEKDGPGLGVRIGKPMSPMWDFQMGSTFARVSDSGNNMVYRQAAFDIDGLLMFSRSRFRPFIVLGLGTGYEKQVGPGIDDGENGPFVDAGVGFQYSFSDRMALQADIRRVNTFWREISPAASKNNYLNVGLNITLGSKPAPVARIEPPAPPVAAAPIPAPRFEKLTLSAQELFPFNSASLSAGSAAPASGESSDTPLTKLDQIAEVLRNHPDVTNVAVNGYADRLGSKKYNLELSQKRADAVKDYLVSKGVDASRIVASGKGEADPVAECENTNRAELIDCLAPNRRVEVEDITVEHRVQ